MEISGGIAIAALPLLAIGFGASEPELGKLAAAQRVPYILLCVLCGSLSDRTGSKVLAMGQTEAWHYRLRHTLAAQMLGASWLRRRWVRSASPSSPWVPGPGRSLRHASPPA